MILISYFCTEGKLEIAEGVTMTAGIGFGITSSVTFTVSWLILVAVDSLYTYLLTTISLPLLEGEIRVNDDEFDWGITTT
jgi:hypothetical protein